MGDVSIGLFGGTFDPIHDGHISLIKSFLASGKVQEVWVVPTFEPSHRKTDNLLPFRTRLEMVRLAVQDIPGVTVSDIEYKLPKPSFSVQTIGEFKKLFPFYQLYWCLGGDQLASFHNWVLFDAILFMSKLLVAERPGHGTDHILNAILEMSEFVEHEPINISSTIIREQIKNGRIEDAAIPELVKNYIKEHKLYLD